MKKPAILAAEGTLLLLVLVGYLTVIAAALRDVGRTLRLITVGVRAIERQTEPMGSLIAEINDNLDQAATRLREAAGSEATTE